VKALGKHLLKRFRGCDYAVLARGEVETPGKLTRTRERCLAPSISLLWKQKGVYRISWERNHPQTCWVLKSLGGGQSDH
jgi:hypothetical protein